jgi:hypothetical protein
MKFLKSTGDKLGEITIENKPSKFNDLLLEVKNRAKRKTAVYGLEDSDNNKIILVEHETGLEILYISGSIASLIGLIPIIISTWKHFRSKFNRRNSFYRDADNIEIRKFNSKNILTENRINSVESYLFSAFYEENRNLAEKVNKLEKRVKKSENEIKILKTKI